jgi:hypothetical protein
MSTISDLFDRWKKAKGITVDHVACHYLGVNVDTLSIWREGGPAQIEHIERMAGDIGIDRDALWTIIAACMKEAQAWNAAHASSAPADDQFPVIGCKEFVGKSTSVAVAPVEAIEQLAAWRRNNPRARVINVETIISTETGSFATRVDTRAIGVRVWFEEWAGIE